MRVGPYFAILCFEKPGVGELRDRTRPAHLALSQAAQRQDASREAPSRRARKVSVDVFLVLKPCATRVICPLPQKIDRQESTVPLSLSDAVPARPSWEQDQPFALPCPRLSQFARPLSECQPKAVGETRKHLRARANSRRGREPPPASSRR